MVVLQEKKCNNSGCHALGQLEWLLTQPQPQRHSSVVTRSVHMKPSIYSSLKSVVNEGTLRPSQVCEPESLGERKRRVNILGRTNASLLSYGTSARRHLVTLYPLPKTKNIKKTRLLESFGVFFIFDLKKKIVLSFQFLITFPRIEERSPQSR